MARSATQDPIDRFRFSMTFLVNPKNDLSFKSSDSVSTIGKSNTDSEMGFSEIVLPKVNVGEVSYRENNYTGTSSKMPGLTTFEPVVLRKGATSNQSMYDWFTDVSDDAANLNIITKNAVALNIYPSQSVHFRKDLVISAKNREGTFTKHWVLFDAFPISYKGGNDLGSTSEEKLIEEITLTYETFIEVVSDSLNDVIHKVNQRIEHAGKKAAIAGLINTVATSIGSI